MSIVTKIANFGPPWVPHNFLWEKNHVFLNILSLDHIFTPGWKLIANSPFLHHNGLSFVYPSYLYEMYQFILKYLYENVYLNISLRWDGKSFLTASALIPNFPSTLLALPNEQLMGGEKRSTFGRNKTSFFEDDDATLFNSNKMPEMANHAFNMAVPKTSHIKRMICHFRHLIWCDTWVKHVKLRAWKIYC